MLKSLRPQIQLNTSLHGHDMLHWQVLHWLVLSGRKNQLTLLFGKSVPDPYLPHKSGALEI